MRMNKYEGWTVAVGLLGFALVAWSLGADRLPVLGNAQRAATVQAIHDALPAGWKVNGAPMMSAQETVTWMAGMGIETHSWPWKISGYKGKVIVSEYGFDQYGQGTRRDHVWENGRYSARDLAERSRVPETWFGVEAITPMNLNTDYIQVRNPGGQSPMPPTGD